MHKRARLPECTETRVDLVQPNNTNATLCNRGSHLTTDTVVFVAVCAVEAGEIVRGRVKCGECNVRDVSMAQINSVCVCCVMLYVVYNVFVCS